MLIDFTNCRKTNKTYGGANGNKICVIYNDERYMLKFADKANRNDALSYKNSCVSEYIGCHIFNEVGIPAQETILGTYEVNGNTMRVVACKDLCAQGQVIQDFASLKNQIINSSRSGKGTELTSIENAIEEQSQFDPVMLSEFFWNMFIIDAFIGNWDRHNGNWGFLYDDITDTATIAPVFDCGSSLYPQADPSIMKAVLKNENGALDIRVYEIPTSSLQINNRRINYFDFISSLENERCNNALARMADKIDMIRIKEIIDETPGISTLDKDFYYFILSERKKRIIDISYKKLLETRHLYKNVNSTKSDNDSIIPVIDNQETALYSVYRKGRCR